MSHADSGFQCCFCGLTIEARRPDPVHLVVHGEEEEQQALYAHYRCLRKVLHDSVPLYVFTEQ